MVDAFIELTRAEPIDNRDAAEQQQMSEMIHAFTKERGVSAAATAPRAEPEALRSLLENVAFGIGRDVEYVLFLYRPAADSLVASSVASVVTTNVLKLPLGESVSGWVGANRRSIINSDAALDLGATATEREAPLRGCAAVPITAGEQLLGVLTFYSTRSQAFTVAHAAGLECLAQLVALGLQRSLFAMPRSQESVVFRVPGRASFKRSA
ncbi:MAG: GAF domain-containing protein [Acidobacteria bacterium]|nr:GAF domain-containing protein [Acidobacteriota bacterium]